MPHIRPLIADDLPAVTRIVQRHFQDPRRPASPALADCLADLLLHHPAHDPELPSRVFVTDDDAVTGFVGVVPVAMEFHGRRLRAAVPTCLAVEDAARHPLAGARLVRALLDGPQDLSVSEPINPTACGLWQTLGAKSAATESMEWLRLFAPGGLACALVAGGHPHLARAAGPAAGVADRLGRQLAGGLLAPPAPERGAPDCVPADTATFADAFAEVGGSYDLRPAIAAPTLDWMLAHAAANRSRGAFCRRIVVDRRGRTLGCFLYYGRRGGIAFVLQVLARPEAAAAVVDALLRDTHAAGCVAAKGRTQARLLDALLQRRALLFRRHSAMVHARDPALVGAVLSGAAVTGGLVGEAWMRHVSDRLH